MLFEKLKVSAPYPEVVFRSRKELKCPNSDKPARVTGDIGHSGNNRGLIRTDHASLRTTWKIRIVCDGNQQPGAKEEQKR